MTRTRIVACVASLALACAAPREPTQAPVASARTVCPLGGCVAPSDAASATPPACATPTECATDVERACDAALPGGCTARALDVWAARGPGKAMGDVVALFDRACTLGDPEGCAYAGRLLLDGRGERNDGRGVELLERACDDGVVRACDALVRMNESRASRARFRANDRYSLQARCLRGDGNSCFYVGVGFERGTNGFPKDVPRGAAAYARGCDAGERVSCNNLANDYYYGDGVPLDFARAAELYDRACRAGEPIGCANVGFIAEYGDGVPLDMNRAAEMYAVGCQGQSSYACIHQEMLGEYRRGTPHDPAKAVDRWRRACDGGDARSCAYFGVMCEDGKGIARDEARALSLMKKACASKVALACAWIREHGGG